MYNELEISMQILYHLYLNSTGYSVASQDYILAMKNADPSVDIKVNYLNAATAVGVSPNRQQLFAAMKQKPDASPQIAVYHSIPHRYRRPRGPTKYIGICLFETMNPPPGWITMMSEMDSIITASQFNKRIFETNGLSKPVHVVPHGFDPALFHKDVKPLGRYRPFTFLAIGTWKNRKNWEMLIKSFYDAFEAKDDVCLYVKTDKPKDFEIMVQRVKRTTEWKFKDTAPIYCEHKNHQHFEDIPSLMKKGDVYISVSLGEGFGLPGLHAMALGIPVITTRYGGVLEYAKPEFCTYVDPYQYKTYPVMDGIPQFNNCIWPVIRISEIRDKMRYVKDNYKKEIAQKATDAYNFVHKKFSYSVVGADFLKALTHD